MMPVNMNEEEFKKIMIRYKFRKVSEITRNDSGKIEFSYPEGEEQEGFGFVYLWVEVAEKTHNIVYVGKAGKTIKYRMSQHIGGFNGGSKSGERKRDLIIEGIKNNHQYFVFSRKSPPMVVLEEDVPGEIIEEIAFIKKFEGRLWNRLKRKKGFTS